MAFVALAHRLCDVGRGAEAEEICRHGLLQHPGLATGLVALGRVLLACARPLEAQDVLIAAARAHPDHGEAFRWLGEVLIRRGDLAHARIILEYAEELSPHDGRVADLVTRAGGTPKLGPARLLSDFEHTRVTNARALAERMLDEPGEPNTPTVITDPPAHMDDAPVERLPARPPSAAAPPAPVSLRGLSRNAAPSPAAARRKAATAVVLAVGIAGAAVVALALRRAPAPVRDLRGDLASALASGSLRSLLEARELGRRMLAAAPEDGDAAAALALANAFLARDYGLPAEREAQGALGRAAAAPTSLRTATVEAARALLAIGEGALDAAALHAGRAIGASPEAPWAAVARARVAMHRGDLEAARRDLERTLAAAPHLAAAVMDWATVWIDLGDPATAARSLEPLLGRNKEHTRARLLLAEAQRALGLRPDIDARDAACRREQSQSRAILAGCALAASAEARLDGDRATAVKSALAAAAEAPADARLLASASVSLAVVGEMDAAALALEKARRLYRPSAVPLAWADLAVNLGRGLLADPGPPAGSAAGPERRLLAARAALERGGSPALAAALAATPAGLVAYDNDLRAFAFLGRELAVGRGGPSKGHERPLLGRLANQGDPVAAYVLGRVAARSGDAKQAARLFEKALWGHGDACAAAAAYSQMLGDLGRQVASAVFRPLRAQNATCPIAQL